MNGYNHWFATECVRDLNRKIKESKGGIEVERTNYGHISDILDEYRE